MAAFLDFLWFLGYLFRTVLFVGLALALLRVLYTVAVFSIRMRKIRSLPFRFLFPWSTPSPAVVCNLARKPGSNGFNYDVIAVGPDWIHGCSVWVCSADGVEQMALEPLLFRVVSPIGNNPNTAELQELDVFIRKKFAEVLLGIGQVEELVPSISTHCNNMLQELKKGTPERNLEILSVFSMSVATCMLGMGSDCARFLDCWKKLRKTYSSTSSFWKRPLFTKKFWSKLEYKLLRRNSQSDDILRDLRSRCTDFIRSEQQRIASGKPRGDGMKLCGNHKVLLPFDLLLPAQRNIPEFDQVLAALMVEAIITVHETVLDSLKHALCYTAALPSVQDWILIEARTCKLQDIGDVPISSLCCILESMRLSPPSTFFSTRVALSDITIQNQPIGKGTRIRIAVDAVHRNLKHWRHPNSFFPERFQSTAESGNFFFGDKKSTNPHALCLIMDRTDVFSAYHRQSANIAATALSEIARNSEWQPLFTLSFKNKQVLDIANVEFLTRENLSLARKYSEFRPHRTMKFASPTAKLASSFSTGSAVTPSARRQPSMNFDTATASSTDKSAEIVVPTTPIMTRAKRLQSGHSVSFSISTDNSLNESKSAAKPSSLFQRLANAAARQQQQQQDQQQQQQQQEQQTAGPVSATSVSPVSVSSSKQPEPSSLASTFGISQKAASKGDLLSNVSGFSSPSPVPDGKAVLGLLSSLGAKAKKNSVPMLQIPNAVASPGISSTVSPTPVSGELTLEECNENQLLAAAVPNAKSVEAFILPSTADDISKQFADCVSTALMQAVKGGKVKISSDVEDDEDDDDDEDLLDTSGSSNEGAGGEAKVKKEGSLSQNGLATQGSPLKSLDQWLRETSPNNGKNVKAAKKESGDAEKKMKEEERKKKEEEEMIRRKKEEEEMIRKKKEEEEMIRRKKEEEARWMRAAEEESNRMKKEADEEENRLQQLRESRLAEEKRIQEERRAEDERRLKEFLQQRRQEEEQRQQQQQLEQERQIKMMQMAEQVRMRDENKRLQDEQRRQDALDLVSRINFEINGSFAKSQQQQSNGDNDNNSDYDRFVTASTSSFPSTTTQTPPSSHGLSVVAQKFLSSTQFLPRKQLAANTKSIAMSTTWGPAKFSDDEIDITAGVAIFGNEGQHIDDIFFNSNNNRNTMNHMADGHLIESISISLDMLSPSARILFFTICVHTPGYTFQDTSGVKCAIVSAGSTAPTDPGDTVCVDSIAEASSCSIICCLKRNTAGTEWIAFPMRAFCNGRSLFSVRSTLQSFLDALDIVDAEKKDGPQLQDALQNHAKSPRSSISSIRLKQNDSFPLHPAIRNLAVGIKWNIGQGEDLDLDSGAVVFDHNNQHIEDVYFHRKIGQDGGIQHGDLSPFFGSREDNEIIHLRLDFIRPEVHTIVFTLCIFTRGYTFGDVSACHCRFMDSSNSNHELCKFSMEGRSVADSTALAICCMQRIDENRWDIRALGVPQRGRTVREIRNQIEMLITKGSPQNSIFFSPTTAMQHNKYTTNSDQHSNQFQANVINSNNNNTPTSSSNLLSSTTTPASAIMTGFNSNATNASAITDIFSPPSSSWMDL